MLYSQGLGARDSGMRDTAAIAHWGEVGNENSARSSSDRSFFYRPGDMDVRAFGSWMSAPKCLFFFQDFEGLTEVFAPGRPPGYPRGRPLDIRPQDLLFGLLFRS